MSTLKRKGTFAGFKKFNLEIPDEEELKIEKKRISQHNKDAGEQVKVVNQVEELHDDIPEQVEGYDPRMYERNDAKPCIIYPENEYKAN